VSPAIIQAQLQALRLKYNAVYAAYRGCVEALSKVSIEGKTPSADLLRKEATALRELTEARANLLAAMRDSSDEKLA
jgi:hypothetical protein